MNTKDLEELKEKYKGNFTFMCKNTKCSECGYQSDEVCSELDFIIDCLNSQGLLREPITVNDIDLDYHNLMIVVNDYDAQHKELDLVKYLESKKSEFLKIKGRE